MSLRTFVMEFLFHFEFLLRLIMILSLYYRIVEFSFEVVDAAASGSAASLQRPSGQLDL